MSTDPVTTIDRQSDVDEERVIEPPAYVLFAQRIITAAGRRIARHDPSSLALFAHLQTELDRAKLSALKAQHEAGFSLAEMAAGLGCSKQAVAQFIMRGTGKKGKAAEEPDQMQLFE